MPIPDPAYQTMTIEACIVLHGFMADAIWAQWHGQIMGNCSQGRRWPFEDIVAEDGQLGLSLSAWCTVHMYTLCGAVLSDCMQ